MKLKMSQVQMIKVLPMGDDFISESRELRGSSQPAYVLCDVNLLFPAPVCTYIILRDICKQSLTFYFPSQTNMRRVS